jgi:predicted amidohydrolase YtcJ
MRPLLVSPVLARDRRRPRARTRRLPRWPHLDRRRRSSRRRRPLLVVGERIVGVGSDAEILARAGDRATRVDLAGRRVVPGITDSHVHFLSGGDELLAPDLRSAQSADEVARRPRDRGGARAEGHVAHERLVGPRELARRRAADRRPRSIVRAGPSGLRLASRRAHGGRERSSRCAWRASRATRPTPRAARSCATRAGEPAGVLKDNAMSLVGRHVPTGAPSQRSSARSPRWRTRPAGRHGLPRHARGYEALATYQTLKAPRPC